MLPLGQLLGQVVMDNTLGQAGPLDGPNFQIPAKLGETVGNNLFHSFAEFSLEKGQSATFTGPAQIQNILGRVTGENTSQIDGLIKSEIAGAGLFLLNPNGFVLGMNAEVDVSGSFVLTAQDKIKLGDLEEFKTQTDVSSFSQAAPEAYGFLGGNPTGNIEISARDLMLAVDGGTLDFVGKKVTFKKNANLEVSGFDDVRVEADNIGMDFGSSISATNTREGMPTDITFKADYISMNHGFLGNFSKKKGMPTGEISMIGSNGSADRIEISNQSRIEIKNKGGEVGDLAFEADILEIKKRSKVDLKSSGAQGPSLKVNAKFFKTVDSDVECLTTGTEGVGGGIEVNADEIELSGYLRTRSGSNAISGSWTGDIDIQSMRMAATGGDIILNAKSVKIEKTSIIRKDPLSWVTTNGMESSLSTIATSAGDAGDIIVNADNLTMLGGSWVGGSQSLGIATRTLCSIYSWTKIRPYGELKVKAGRSGDIYINCRDVKIIDSSIKSISNGSGDLGNIVMDGKTLQVVGVNDKYGFEPHGYQAWGPHISNRVLSDWASADWKFEDAQNGNIILTFKEIEMLSAGIVADSMGRGKGGRVELKCDAFKAFNSGFRAYVDKEGVGRDIVINAGEIDLESSRFESTTNGVGVGADIRLTAERSLYIRKSRFDTDRVQTAKNTKGRDAGGLYFNAPEIRISNQSKINSSVGGSANGDGGDVILKGDRIIIDGLSKISSDIQGRGKGGLIKLEAKTSIAIDDSSFSASSLKPRNATRFGDGGTIQLSAPLVSLKNGAEMKTDTASKGDGGEVQIDAELLVVEGAGSHGYHSRILSETNLVKNKDNSQLAGDAGQVSINVDSVVLRDGGYISTASKGIGDAGEISIKADHLLMENGFIKSEGKHEGAAGSVDFRVSKGMSLGQTSEISVTASQADGGDIRITTDGYVRLANSKLTASAAGNGGSVRLLGSGAVFLAESGISAEAGQDGGNIEVHSPDTLVLQRSGLVANAIHGNGGYISIAADGYLPSLESTVSISSEFGLEGSVEIDTPETNVGSGLLILPDNLMEGEVNIAERCAMRLSGDTSSFFINGNGGLSVYSSENYLPSIFTLIKQE